MEVILEAHTTPYLISNIMSAAAVVQWLALRANRARILVQHPKLKKKIVFLYNCGRPWASNIE